MPVDRVNLPRTPNGKINNCNLAHGDPMDECQMCLGKCPDLEVLAKEESEREEIEKEHTNPNFVEVDRLSFKTGKITVVSQLNRLDSTIEEREIEVDPFVTNPVVVSRSYEAVIKGKDGYPAGKVSCFVAWPCYREEFKETLEAVGRVAKNEVRKDVAKATSKLGLKE